MKVIGGSDGPTAVFVATSVWKPVALICVALAVAAAVYLIWRKNKK